MDINRCLQAFGLHVNDRLLVVKEQHLAESNFVISYLLKQVLLDEHNQVILVLTHNSIGHYECVAKRLGYNLTRKIHEGFVKTIDIQALILKSIEVGNFQLNILANIEQMLCNHVYAFVAKLKDNSGQTSIGMKKTGKMFVFIDDFTHLHDCTLNVGDSINFLNSLLGHHYNDDYVGYIVGMHMGGVDDKILSSDLEYSADCIIDISLMKTGRSDDVSGVMKVIRNRKMATYHYKVKEYGIDMYKPGEILIR